MTTRRGTARHGFPFRLAFPAEPQQLFSSSALIDTRPSAHLISVGTSFPLQGRFVAIKRFPPRHHPQLFSPELFSPEFFSPEVSSSFGSLDVTAGIPEEIAKRSSLGSSQLEAVHRLLTKELAICQGPPGTAKTSLLFLGSSSLRSFSLGSSSLLRSIPSPARPGQR